MLLLNLAVATRPRTHGVQHNNRGADGIHEDVREFKRVVVREDFGVLLD